MHIFDVFEAWLFSMTDVLASAGVTAQFQRSPVDWANPSCTLNMRCGDQEIELSLWESGYAELIEGSFGGPIRHVHFDDVRNRSDLGALLASLIKFSQSGRSTEEPRC